MPLTHILFDFFGTLVEYSASRVEQGYPGSYAVLRDAGVELTYEACLHLWDAAFADLDRATAESLDEYSMDEVAIEVLSRALGRAPSAELAERWRDRYLQEWSAGVQPLDGVAEMLEALAAQHTLVLVTNTHHAPLVAAHLEAMGVARHFATVVTSAEHGKRKPSPCIFEHALASVGGTAEQALYVGDSYDADYRGALGAGMDCYLIDPNRRHDVPEAHRLRSVLELPDALARGSAPRRDR